jgi:hypothetical protein
MTTATQLASTDDRQDTERAAVPGLVVRPATVRDAPAILGLVNGLAQQQIMLPRSPASVIEGIRNFVVADLDPAMTQGLPGSLPVLSPIPVRTKPRVIR